MCMVQWCTCKSSVLWLSNSNSKQYLSMWHFSRHESPSVLWKTLWIMQTVRKKAWGKTWECKNTARIIKEHGHQLKRSYKDNNVHSKEETGLVQNTLLKHPRTLLCLQLTLTRSQQSSQVQPSTGRTHGSNNNVTLLEMSEQAQGWGWRI